MGRVPHRDSVIVHANLNRGGTGIVPVNDGVDHRLSHGLARHGEGLDAVEAIVRDQGPRVLRVQQIHRPLDLREQVSLDNILKQQLRATEVADLDDGLHEKLVRRRMKEQDRGAFQQTRFPQLKLLDHGLVGLTQDIRWQPLALATTAPKVGENPAIQTVEINARQGDIVPSTAVLLKQEAGQGSSLQHLLCAPGAIVELPPVADRVRMGLDHDLQVLQAGFRLQVHLDDDAEQRLHLVGDLLEEPINIAHPDDLPAVVPADLEDAALGVGESADPLQVLVAPGRLPLDDLGLRRHEHGPVCGLVTTRRGSTHALRVSWVEVAQMPVRGPGE